MQLAMRVTSVRLVLLFTLCLTFVSSEPFQVKHFKCKNETLTGDEQKAATIALEQLDEFPGFRQIRRGRHAYSVIYAKAHCLTNEIDECVECVKYLTHLTQIKCKLANGAIWLTEKCKIRYENYFFRSFEH